MGYHTKEIVRGELGNFSKIKEEFEEMENAIEQNNNILALCEAADLLGALEAWLATFNLKLSDANKMMQATKSAFADGTRS